MTRLAASAAWPIARNGRRRQSETAKSAKAAGKVIESFATRAFRRPVKADEVERYLKLYDRAHARGD